jgi:hypothetical protein
MAPTGITPSRNIPKMSYNSNINDHQGNASSMISPYAQQ